MRPTNASTPASDYSSNSFENDRLNTDARAVVRFCESACTGVPDAVRLMPVQNNMMDSPRRSRGK
jgi:hypothetical protein